jgi:putative ABC transport system ATP-binding protein
VLRIEGLIHSYPGAAALAFADFAAGNGATVLIHGASGSGKSTLLALLAGLLTVQQGSVRVAGTELASLGQRARDAWRARTLGVMPQRLHLSPSLTVRGNLELAYLAAGSAVDKARVGELLGHLGLDALADRKPHQLSLGQVQRVALARALLRKPAVLLVDEPTANLDDAAAAAVLALLAAHSRDARAVLVVATHDARVRHALLPGARELLLATNERGYAVRDNALGAPQ